jgi:acetylornithine deacetylase/succinyl-diaminopimelate desuccinylase-like protein
VNRLGQAQAQSVNWQHRCLHDLKRLIRFPSVSAQPRHAADVQRCAAWLATHLGRIGLDRAQVIPTGRHPLVMAESRHAPGQPTVLLYGHYDVVPADGHGWHSPPFEPVVRGEHLYGRGASDDKGPLMAHLKALEHLLRSTGSLPVNVIVLCDGEEEIGSPSLPGFLEHQRHALRADVAVISDTRMLGLNRPTIVSGLRGSLSLELEVRGPRRDLHSGSFGGAIHNPLQVLAEVLAGLHDTNGRVRVPGFYDRVRRVGREVRSGAAQHAPSAVKLYAEAGVPRGWGEAGFSAFERTTIRPTLTITGLNGGYGGVGHKSIIPARGIAKLNLRLVPDQDPLDVERLLRQHLIAQTPASVQSHLRRTAAAHPMVLNTRHPAVGVASAALERHFGQPVRLLRSGGSIPVVNHFKEVLGLETVLMGFALPDDAMHSVNERFHLPTYLRAIRVCTDFYANLGRGSTRTSQFANTTTVEG